MLAIGGQITRAVIPELCERLWALLKEHNARCVVCDVGALIDPDAVAIDALARLQLTARRCGREFRLRHARGTLQDLLALIGLSDVVRLELAREPGQAEERE